MIDRPQMRELLTTSEVAQMFRISVKTVRAWHAAGRFPDGTVIKTPGNQRRYDADYCRPLLAGPR